MSGGNSLIFGAFSSPKRMRNRHSFENDRKAADHLRRCCRIARPDISLRSKGELSKRVLLARPHQQTMLGNLNIAIYLFLDRCRTPSRHPQQRAILPFRRIEANPGLPAAQTSLRGRPLVRRHRGPTRPAGARGISGHHGFGQRGHPRLRRSRPLQHPRLSRIRPRVAKVGLSLSRHKP